MTDWMYVGLAFVGGAAIAVQAGVNTRLSVWTGDPVRAVLVSFAVGTATLALLAIAAGRPLPSRPVTDVPWWAWSGGFLGVFYLVGAVAAAPRLGAAALIALVVAGQAFAALVLDHFGLVGFTQRPMNVERAAGVAFLIVGVLLVRGR